MSFDIRRPALDAQSIIAKQVEKDMRMAGKFDAEDLFKFAKRQIEEFEKELKDNEEIGIKLANFGEVSEIHIRNISYQNPNIMVFSGINKNRESVQLFQHISQLNLMLIACNSFNEEKPFRIGYIDFES